MFTIQNYKPAIPPRGTDHAARQQGPRFQGLPRFQPDVFDISGCQLVSDPGKGADTRKSRLNILA